MAVKIIIRRCYSGSDGKSVEKDCLRAENENAAASAEKGSRRSRQQIALSSVFIAFDTSIFSRVFQKKTWPFWAIWPSDHMRQIWASGVSLERVIKM